MIQNLEAYERLTTGFDATISNGLLSLPVKYNEAIKLPYPRACINERMRLHPSVGLGMSREVPSCRVKIYGCYILEKFILGMDPAGLQYNTHGFGPDAEQYNPDRWVGADGEHMEKAMLHFGYGTHICLGKTVSL